MIYSENIKKAMNIAYQAHKNQVDKNGYPYIAHPLHLAEQMTTENTAITALLHDVVEDSDITLFDLENYGFDTEIIKAVKLLTRQNNITYKEYIEKIKTNDIARTIKIADLKHNLDMTRLDNITPNDIKRAEKYKKSLAFLIE